ncbi:MAG: flagellar basal body-associated FliL family protein [Verrucomicrobiota bacterium]
MAEPSKTGGDPAKSEAGASANGVAQISAAPGGLKSWLPLIVTVVVMPVLAYATTAFVLVPKLQKAASPIQSEAKDEPGKGGEGQGAKEAHDATGKVRVPLSKNIMVNVAGSQGTRYIVAGLTLVGTGPDFEGKIKRSDDQIRDLASNILCAKSISDLEKAGARNLIRSELLSVFNTALGNGLVQEIYLTDFAVQ